MLENLLRHLRDSKPETTRDNRELAAAVLLLEVARADFEHHPLELEAIRNALAVEFSLTPAALDQLLIGAEKESHTSVSLHAYVQALNRTLSADEKCKLLRRLWQVAYADGKIDALEEHTLRRLADLLYVPHAEFIRGKLAAADS